MPPDRKIKDLPIGVRQRVEILKALYRNAELLILDEPTSVLTPQEAEVLFKTLLELKAHGKTHHLHLPQAEGGEAHRRQGHGDARCACHRHARGGGHERAGHRLPHGRPGDQLRAHAPRRRRSGPTLLEARGLSFVNDENLRVLRNVSFDVRAGEIVGLAGVEGNGQTELVRILTGLLPASAGQVSIRGRRSRAARPARIREAGAAHIPEDRMEDGAAAEASAAGERDRGPLLQGRASPAG